MTLTTTPRTTNPAPAPGSEPQPQTRPVPVRSPRVRRPGAPSQTRRGRPASSLAVVRMATWIVCVISGGALFFLTFLLVLSPLQQSRAQDVLYTQFRSEVDATTAPFGVDPIPLGHPVALLEIPAIDVHQVVVEGTTSRQLQNGPGHYRISLLPGQVGTSVIFGKSTTYGAPFHDLTHLKLHDPIQVTTGQGVFTYTVEDVRAEGDPQPPPLAAGQARLLLVSTDTTTLGALSTIYVDAILTSPAAPTPPRPALITTPGETEMASDATAYLALVLWLFALIGIGTFIAWAYTHWGKPQTWVIAAPLLLVALWCTSDNAALLLPNLM